MSFILLLKWSAKSSKRASVGDFEDLFKFVFVKRSIVEKRNFWLFLCSLMIFLEMGVSCLFDCIIIGFEVSTYFCLVLMVFIIS